MNDATRMGGCPLHQNHNQAPDLSSNDPLEQINAGNFETAIRLYEKRDENGQASAEDYALVAHAYRNVGDFATAATWFQKAVDADPQHRFAESWKAQVARNKRDGASGVGIARPNPLTAEYLRTDPQKTYEHHPDSWVLCTDFKRPGDYIPGKSLLDHLRNAKDSATSMLLVPVGWLAARGATPGNPGRWTQRKLGILQLAALAHGRQWMEARERDPDGERGDPPGQLEAAQRPSYADSGFTPDGAHGSFRWAGEGRVGQEFVDHGMPEGYRPKDRSQDPGLPSEAELARVFGYRNGKTIEAMTASFHAAAHLQGLVHDVAQTTLDSVKKHAIPIDPDSELAQLGVKYNWSRSDAPNAIRDGGEGMHSTTVWWDMSHIYGSDIETLAKLRSFPDGTHVPGGKLYLEGMDKNGEGGQWLPLVENENGQQQILTGFGRNMTAPLEAEHTLYARHHNWVCDVFRGRYPEWSDNQIFQIARRVVTMTYVKIHTGTWTHTLFANPAVVDGLNANLFGRAERKLAHFEKRIYRPEQGTDPIAHGIAAGKVDKRKPEVKGNYFSKAYRFGHQIWVDQLKCPPIGEKSGAGTREVSMMDLRELDGHVFLREEGLGSVYYYMMNTRLGAPVTGNTADFFRDMATEEGVVNMLEQEIRKDRQRGTPGFCDYQRSHDITPIEKWEDLFIDPTSEKSKATIQELQRLYPKGVETLDSVIGLTLNEHRPDGLEITNEGFQTFVQEATSRIRKNPWLTEKWRPDEVGWTAINLVEAVDKEKLLYLHCPELREWLQNRETTNTYEYVGTSPKEAPDEHPLETRGMVIWGEQHLQDMGLGDAWKDEHFKENVPNDMLRLEHEATGRTYIVDLTEKSVLADVDNDGRIQAREVLHEDPEGVTLEALISAAEDIRAEKGMPLPGYESPAHPGLKSGGLLIQQEVNRLKQYNGDKDGRGVAVRPNAA